MNKLQVFNNEIFGQVRIVEIDNEPWFCLSDVCRVLEISNSRDVRTRLMPPGVVTTDIGVQTGVKADGTPAMQIVGMTFINEPNLYKAVFQSRKPESERFADWVTSEVIPSIRKHGAYMTEQVIEQALASPDFLIQLATQLKEEKSKNMKLEADNSMLTVKNQIMQPKAEYFDELVDRNLLTSFRDTAKELKIGERAFVKFLLQKKYVYRDGKGKIQPYADKNDGLFEVKECFNEKTEWRGTQTLITPKGRETFRLLYIEG